MAQNINPFYSSQNAPSKATEEKQNVPKDNHAVSKRLQKELMVLMMSTEKGVSAFPDGENLFKWIGTITGPRDTVYAGLTYKLTLEFPQSYPYSAPIVRFATPCFHPNVDAVVSKANNFLTRVRSKSYSEFRLMCTGHASQHIEERKIKVGGVDINYLKVGTGEHPILLLPGALGSIWTDFRPQIENLDRNKFTIVGWDPPGYGKSRPPNRTFPDDFFHRDAAWACDLMKTLGYTKFSLVGWSDGAITSLIAAASYRDNVRKLVAVAGNAYVAPEEIDIYQKFRSIDGWSEKMRAPLIEIYGEDYFRKTWADWVDSVVKIARKRKDGNLCRELIPQIRCPTLIVRGAKDAMVLPEHGDYLKEHIAGARLKTFEKGAHNLHLRYHEEFNSLITQFLLED